MARFFNYLARLEGVVVTATFLIMVALFAVNVAARSFFPSVSTQLFWIDELVRLLMLYLVFLSCGLALQQGRHVGVYAWRERIAARTHLPLRAIIDVVGVVFCLYMAWLSYKTFSFVLGSKQIIPSLGLSASWLYIAPAAGFVLMAMRFAASLFGLIDRYSPQMQEAGE